MTINANLDKLLDKAFEKYDLEKLPTAPVSALAGVSDADAESLAKAFNIKTIGDLGRNKHFRAAVAIVNLVEAAK
ncbi:hypothetical protein [Nonomuraea aurantiaca]|uniref:hypothetical protein n=1 Tax=Nonomuraea aurantiaca TaxID=2878562 RepID=UPI001CDA322D|nr:hypothetical protein [Nonomuraea aurantiaca]MCA2226644.1 hypothetical protein [Nonomuraea aurantiaca]